MPPPEPRSRTRSPSWRSATAIGLPQPRLASTAASGREARSLTSYSWAPQAAVSQAASALALGLQQSSPQHVAACGVVSRTLRAAFA